KLIAEWRDGTRTAQSLKEAGKELTEQKFGPLMTQNLGDKLKEKLAHIQEDFQAGFGRGLTGRAAEKEYRERANAAMRETGGFGKTDQEIAKDAAESAGLARAAGRPGAAEKIEADALRDQVQRIKERADRRAGLLGPHADLATAEERARAGIASIVEQRREGGFGQGPDADRLARRAVLAQLQPIANAQQGFQAHFEGLQDSWKRAQASAASSNTPEEKMVKAIDKLAPLLEAIGVNTENLKGEVKVVMKPVMTD
nr:hypothetical protein [Pirellulales bacterium]